MELSNEWVSNNSHIDLLHKLNINDTKLTYSFIELISK